MPKLQFTIIAITFLISGCSDDVSKNRAAESEKLDVPALNHSIVDKPIALKNLIIGMNIKEIKSAKKYSNQAYMFDFEYFGGKRVFRVATNEKGVIYRYEATLDGSFDALKSALEEKLTADNGRAVAFECNANSVKPDSSAEISTRSCRISGQSDALVIEEMKMQPTAKYAGLPQLPTVILSIKLEGTGAWC